jgi:hypothetical protein
MLHALILLVPSLALVSPAEDAVRIAGEALVGGRAYALAAELADRIGPRPAGSANAARAVKWAVAAMKAAGLQKVREEPVTVPQWIRGEAAAEVLSPIQTSLHVAALGGSLGTAPGGVTAEIVEARSPEELKALGERARGKIVFISQKMERTRTGEGYGKAVGLRGSGAIEAAKLGAVAAIIRSVGTGAHQLPHTGATRYEDDVPKIPFAAVSAEDADLLERQLAKGPVKLRLFLTAKWDELVASANVVGELPGRVKPDEIVLIGAHLDSWDLGSGALDDGAGCGIVLDAGRILAKLPRSRRTVRVVLFMNEENGLTGARAYATAHNAELPKHVAAMEADLGAGRPIGLTTSSGPAGVAILKTLLAPLATWLSIEPTAANFGGADLIPLQAAAVPVVDLWQDATYYFDWHHTAGDTVDKIDRVDLALETAAFTSLTRMLAESEALLPRVKVSSPF